MDRRLLPEPSLTAAAARTESTGQRHRIVYSAEWLLPAQPCPGFAFEVLLHSLLAASKPLSWITHRGLVSYQTTKYFNEFTTSQGIPWIHRIRLQNSSLCLSTLQRHTPTGGACW
ncbi:hypothetical protein AMECASPLE_016388 [Ameca splendens]|uniref:Uncharacterized protein n=1 Tax=Ameca splendens TaxID=208324 RepID=A0ABV0YD86_9TELE